MTLRRKTLVIIGVTIIGLIMVLYAASRIILLRGFIKLEEQNARKNVERATSALSDELADLNSTAGDWAYWSDTAAFVEGTYDEFIDSNLMDSTFTTLQLNLMLFINPSGQIVFGKAVNLDSEVEEPLPSGLQEHIYVNSLIAHHSDIEDSITGLVLLRESPMLIASLPILTSDREGPIRGTLVIGRYLNSTRIQHLAETTHLSLAMYRLDDPQMPTDLQLARASLSEEMPIFIRPLGTETIAGYTLLKDVYGEPALVLRMDMPREIYQQGQASVSYFVLSLLVAGLAFGVMTLLLLENQILSRLAHISKAVSNIGTSGDLSARLQMMGRDELSRLAGAINDMLKTLQENAARLEESNRDLARRARYLEATAKVARDAASLLDLQQLLLQAATLISERFGFYHVGIFLLDPIGEWAVLQAASSEGGRRMMARGHRLRVGQEGIVGYVTRQGKPRIALDVGADAVFFDNPDLPETRSETALPLRARGEIIGALDVQSKEEAVFTDEDVEVLQTLADQVAMAISNARLFEQVRETLEAGRRAYGELSREAWAETVRARPGLGYRYKGGAVTPLTEHPQSQGESRVDGHELPELALPIRVRGHVIGTIYVHKPDGASEWTAEEVTLMETLTEQLSLALESARLYQDTRRRVTRERLTREITDKMRRATDIDGLMQTAIREMAAALGTPSAFVQWVVPPEPAGDGGEDTD